MGLVPTQDTAYEPHDEVTLVAPEAFHIRLVYEDWTGAQQERTFGRGTWPCKTTKLLGYRTMDPQDSAGWSAVQDLADLGHSAEFSVGKSLEQTFPTQMRRAR